MASFGASLGYIVRLGRRKTNRNFQHTSSQDALLTVGHVTVRKHLSSFFISSLSIHKSLSSLTNDLTRHGDGSGENHVGDWGRRIP